MSRRLIHPVLILGLVVMAAGESAAAPYTFTSINVPGKTFTQANGINDSGQIAGSYQNGTGLHGFIDLSGVISSFDVPGQTGFSTVGRGINAAGQIVGSYDAGGRTLGFVDSNGTFQTVDVSGLQDPNVGNTEAEGINNVGTIVGNYSGQGFVDDSGSLVLTDAPNAQPPSGTFPEGINDKGVIAGYYIDATPRAYGFTEIHDTYATIEVPGSLETYVFGINNLGQVAGDYGDSTGYHGFVESGSKFTTFDVPFPGVTFTGVRGINDSGQIVGNYSDATGVHGFVASPTTSIPEPSSVALLSMASIALGFGTWWRRVAAGIL